MKTLLYIITFGLVDLRRQLPPLNLSAETGMKALSNNLTDHAGPPWTAPDKVKAVHGLFWRCGLEGMKGEDAVLCTIWALGYAPTYAIAEAMVLDKAKVKNNVSRLKAKGWIRAVKDVPNENPELGPVNAWEVNAWNVEANSRILELTKDL